MIPASAPTPPIGRLAPWSLALKIVAGYLALGVLWIFLSDRLLAALVTDPDRLLQLQTYKGWGFVLVTAIALFALLYRSLRSLKQQENALWELVLGVTEAKESGFFPSLVEHLTRAVGADAAFVGEILPTGLGRVKALTVAGGGSGAGEEFDYDPAGVPDAAATIDRIPQEIRLRLSRRGLPPAKAGSDYHYLEAPLADHRGQTLGVLAVLRHQPFDAPNQALSLVKIFAVRAAVELERQRAEQSLQGQFGQISTIFDSLNALVYVTDLENRDVLYMNQYGEAFFGQVCVGQECFQVLQQRTGPFDFVPGERLVCDGEPLPPVIWEFRNSHNDHWYQCIDKAIRWPDGRLVRLEIAIDITERREMDRLKDELLSAVSHEMHTPLTAILGYTEFMLDNEVAAAERSVFLQTMHREAERLNGLINNFLQLQRLRARQELTQPEPLAVDELFTKALTPFRLDPGLPPVRLETEENLPPLLGREKGVLEILENYLANAVKYSPADRNIVLGASRRGQEVLLWVRDQGPGIPAAELERIFTPFYRLDNSDRRESGGTGLGLALVREIAQENNGRAWVESQPGRGSTFFAAFPAIH